MTDHEVGLELPDCTACGACCAIMYKWAQVSESDFIRMGQPHNLVEEGDVEKYAMRTVGSIHKCVALRGEVGKACSCSIYDVRPQGCRDFDKWSPPCVYAVGIYRLGKFTW